MKSKLINYLPAIFQTDAKGVDPDFTDRFLRAFETVLFGNDDPDLSVKGIEKIIDRIHDYLDPLRTPAEFLPWLAGWVALTLKEGKEWYGEDDITEKNRNRPQAVPLAEDEDPPSRNRDLISRIVQLYRRRGTCDGLLNYLEIYVGKNIDTKINEFSEPFQIGVASKVGANTVVGEGRPYYFHVYMVLPVPSRELLVTKKRDLHEIITREKPAHTYYGLTITVPTMQVGVRSASTVGSNTLLGGMIT